MMKPIVSIIMGAYNEEKTICRCIDSILNQTYTNWEFIICNDCSKDKTLDLLMKYAGIDHRIKVLNNKKNLRLAACLNKCLAVAKGKYVARMDADDVSLPERIETQVAYMERHPDIDCVGCSRIIFDEDGDRGIRNEQEYPKAINLLKATPFAHPTILIRKDVIDSLNGYTVSKDTVRAEDLDLWIRFYKNGYKGYNIQTPLYRYHESKQDLKKRNFKAAFGTSKIYLRGYKILGFPKYKYIYAFKPIIVALIPNRIVDQFHKKRLEKY